MFTIKVEQVENLKKHLHVCLGKCSVRHSECVMQWELSILDILSLRNMSQSNVPVDNNASSIQIHEVLQLCQQIQIPIESDILTGVDVYILVVTT